MVTADITAGSPLTHFCGRTVISPAFPCHGRFKCVQDRPDLKLLLDHEMDFISQPKFRRKEPSLFLFQEPVTSGGELNRAKAGDSTGDWQLCTRAEDSG